MEWWSARRDIRKWPWGLPLLFTAILTFHLFFMRRWVHPTKTLPLSWALIGLAVWLGMLIRMRRWGDAVGVLGYALLAVGLFPIRNDPNPSVMTMCAASVGAVVAFVGVCVQSFILSRDVSAQPQTNQGA